MISTVSGQYEDFLAFIQAGEDPLLVDEDGKTARDLGLIELADENCKNPKLHQMMCDLLQEYEHIFISKRDKIEYESDHLIVEWDKKINEEIDRIKKVGKVFSLF